MNYILCKWKWRWLPSYIEKNKVCPATGNTQKKRYRKLEHGRHQPILVHRIRLTKVHKNFETDMEATEHCMVERGDLWMLAEGGRVFFAERGTFNIHQTVPHNITFKFLECNILFSVVSKRLTNYMLSNRYLDTSVQKGGAPWVSECIEHTGVLRQLIREARENEGDLLVV